MIIKKDYLNRSTNYLEEEKKGLNKAIENLDKRYKDNQIERENFLKNLKIFEKRNKNINNKIEKSR